MNKRAFLTFVNASALCLAAAAPTAAWSQSEAVKIGLILPMTGQQAAIGRQVLAGAKLYMAEHGDVVAGKKVELLVKDDTTMPDVAGRLAREAVVNDKVSVLAGFGTTPSAMAAAPVATQSRTPMVVMAAATSTVVSKDRPYVVRTNFAQPETAVVMAEWAIKHGIKKVVTLVSDFGPGIDSEKSFTDAFKANGGTVIESLRVPMAALDFSSALQKVYDLKPDALYAFVPGGTSAVPLVKQFLERGLDKAGVKLIGPGDITDDDQLNNMGDGMLGVITSFHYSADHPSDLNKKFVLDFKKANSFRPNFFAVGGYDGMHVIYEALAATKGVGNGQTLLNAMKGLKWESPRGPVSIDKDTGDIVQNIYLRKVERKDGELYNVEFDVVKEVKDPGKANAAAS